MPRKKYFSEEEKLEARKIWASNYYNKNKLLILEKDKTSRSNDVAKAKERERHRRYRENNREKFNEAARRYKADNREKIIEQRRLNSEKSREKNRLYAKMQRINITDKYMNSSMNGGSGGPMYPLELIEVARINLTIKREIRRMKNEKRQ